MSHDRDQDRALRDHLLELLRGGSAHLGFDEAIEGLPAELRGQEGPGRSPTPSGSSWSTCGIAQWDILEFSRNPDYVELEMARRLLAGRPQRRRTTTPGTRASRAFRRDLQAMQDLVADPKTDLFAKIPWGDGQTILREAMLVADHNAYHVGQIVTVRQGLGAW